MMGYLDAIKARIITPVETKDLYDLLLAVLPTFLGVAERAIDDLPDLSTREDKATGNTQKFYNALFTVLWGLWAVLLAHQDSIQDSVQRFFTEEEKVQENLKRILDELENRFVSEKRNRLAFKRINFQREAGKPYPKLHALRTTLSDDHPLRTEDPSESADEIIRLYSEDPKKRKALLDNLEKAHEFFIDLVPHSSGSDSPCPTSFFLYPRINIRDLTKTLFDTIESNWCLCKAPGRRLHASRKTRLHLTEHQCFETAPSGRSDSSNSKAQFQILFSTNVSGLRWQSTEVSVTNRDCVKEISRVRHRLLENGLCEVIHGVCHDVRPRIAIYGHKLWNLVSQSVRDINQSHSPTQLLDRDFVSLRDLLGNNRIDRNSTISWMEAKDRLILSFILTTSILHFINGPWLKSGFGSENICFLVTNQSQPDITKPYLTTDCSTPLKSGEPTIDLNQPHPFPDILSLGILLLEIARGHIIDIPKDKDRCSGAIELMDGWKRAQAGLCGPIYGYLHQAIFACIVPGKLEQHGLHEVNINERKARKYVFEEVLWPLESGLFKKFKIRPSSLRTENIPVNKLMRLCSFDHGYDNSTAIQEAAQNWFQSLNNVHRLSHESQRRCTKAGKAMIRIKVAVLDTGFEVPFKALQETYCEERINRDQSDDFTLSRKQDVRRGWDTDDDGHGSQVGEIVLKVAPEAVLHVAKVFRHRDDMRNPQMSEQVHNQIARAIEVASNVWKVDIVVISFGFDKRIDSISHVLKNIENPPLFFAATRNDGTNKAMAWPAKDCQVIGVSSTDGYGGKSKYNPTATDGNYPILYAFGEGVPVTGPLGEKQHVNGTSFATPVAAALVATFVSCVRMIVAASGDGPECYARIPERLRNITAMAAVVKACMEKENDNGDKIFLPWDFLKIDNQRILEDIHKVLENV